MKRPTSTGSRRPDRKLDELAALRGAPKSAETLEQLRRALADKANYVVAKAASIAGAQGYSELIPDLKAAFQRAAGADAAKSDAQCWAKNAIARALRELSHDDPGVFVDGLRHVQREPVMGGSQDTAAELRSICAHALVDCRGLRDLELLRLLVDALADPERIVRSNAAQAMGQVPREESALLLRLKILTGDTAPEVIGDCLSALMRIEQKQGVELAGRLLHGDLAFEAVAALGEAREPEAFELLKQLHASTPNRELRAAALRSIGASRRDDAIGYLLDLIATRQSGQEAIAALSPLRGNPEIRERVEAAVRTSDSALLAESFRKEFA